MREVQALLRGEERAKLPLGRQLALYLDPFALFMDVSAGPRQARERALSYNRAMRWMLVPYLRRWAFIAATLFLGLVPGEALAAQSPVFIIPTAAIAIGCCIALTVTALTAAVYLLLGSSGSRQ
ncbi:MAG: hypothetical protein ACT4P3_15320 [Betaproteobacteria bacterium]